MSRYVRDTTEQRTSIKIFMVILSLGASISGSLILSHPASALSLPLVNDVTNLLQQVLPSAPEATPIVPSPLVAPITSNNAPVQQVAPVQASPQNQSTSNSGQLTPSSHTVATPLTPIATTLAPLDANWQKGPRGASKLISAHTATSTASPTNSFSLLQPSEQGWRLLGVVWYWWLLVAVVAFFVVRYRKYIKRVRVFKKPLVS